MSAATVTSGVYPVYKNQFQIATTGRADPATYASIADMESFSVSFDNGVEEWTPMEADGWMRRLKTSKSLTVSINGKRNIGDTGNDYIANMAWDNGTDCNTILKWTLPNGDSVQIPCVINVTSAGGDSTGVEPLEFECLSDGKPTYTEAT